MTGICYRVVATPLVFLLGTTNNGGGMRTAISAWSWTLNSLLFFGLFGLFVSIGSVCGLLRSNFNIYHSFHYFKLCVIFLLTVVLAFSHNCPFRKKYFHVCIITFPCPPPIPSPPCSPPERELGRRERQNCCLCMGKLPS